MLIAVIVIPRYENLLFPTQNISCFSCHSKQYYSAASPNHVQSNFSTNCEDCHSLTSITWGNTNFDHSFFPLVGGHNIADCFSCHTQHTNFKGLTSDCYSCHKQQYSQTKNPDHVQAKFSTVCQDCHNIYSFTQAVFNHASTGFPLTGAHSSVSCQSCHTSGYINTSSECYSCHSNDFASTTDPNHVTQGFSHDCSQCHSTTSWGNANFDHSATGFPLTGAHAAVTCQACHSAGYTNTSNDCYSCHSKDFAGTTDPNHVAQGFPHNCSQCHSTTNWSGATFDHSTTGFTLTGAHVTTNCQSCHSAGYINTPSDCYSCHGKDFTSTTDPNHVTQGFSHDCSQCHSTTNWGDANFDHSTTGFALIGAHATTTCQSCHTSGYSTPPPITCYNCHQSKYQGTSSPSHTAAGLPQTCQDCHTTTAWTQSTFNHTNTGFTLTGAHVSLDCSSCHKGTVTGLTTDCYSCHSQDYSNTTNPPHSYSGISA